jgi:hypothetical protein
MIRPSIAKEAQATTVPMAIPILWSFLGLDVEAAVPFVAVGSARIDVLELPLDGNELVAEAAWLML